MFRWNLTFVTASLLGLLTSSAALATDCQPIPRPAPPGEASSGILFVPECMFRQAEKTSDGSFEGAIEALPIDESIRSSIAASSYRWSINPRTFEPQNIRLGYRAAPRRSRPIRTVVDFEEKIQNHVFVGLGLVTSIETGWYLRTGSLGEAMRVKVIEGLSDRTCGFIKPGDVLLTFNQGGVLQVGEVKLCNQPYVYPDFVKEGDYILFNAGPSDNQSDLKEMHVGLSVHAVVHQDVININFKQQTKPVFVPVAEVRAMLGDGVSP